MTAATAGVPARAENGSTATRAEVLRKNVWNAPAPDGRQFSDEGNNMKMTFGAVVVMGVTAFFAPLLALLLFLIGGGIALVAVIASTFCRAVGAGFSAVSSFDAGDPAIPVG